MAKFAIACPVCGKYAEGVPLKQKWSNRLQGRLPGYSIARVVVASDARFSG